MKKKQSSRSSTSTNRKTIYKFDTKSNVIFEDNTSSKVKFKLISDPKEPMYKHEIPEENK